ncbi:MFS transporter [Patescibacteria group bacterium]|nr:MFS transporter [Patescibacteria group bacterium]MBU2459642.1 MFS transporter [Patescibacteria group bacterium]MBU2544455.1 MFS transporter [Patescibacteria group bacterium]
MLQKAKHHIGNLLPALRSYNFRLYFIGQGVSLVGSWMQTVAGQWLIYPVLTGNKSYLGLVGAINLTPTLVLALLGGVLADRVDKKRTMILFQSFYAVSAFTLFLLIATQSIRIWHVFLAAAVNGIIFAFEMPLRQTLMLSLVEKKDIASALSLNTALFNGARSIGPAIAGLIIAGFGIGPAYLLNSLSFGAVIYAIMIMRLSSQKTQETHRGQRSVRESFQEGIRFIRSNKYIAVLLGLLFLLALFTWPVATLLPIFAHDIFGKGEVGFGMLQSFFGLGGAAGALGFHRLFTAWKNKFPLLVILFGTAFFYIAVFAVSKSFYLSLALALFGGWAVATAITTINSLVQIQTPDALRGRILSFYSVTLIGGMALGALLASAVVGTIGPRMTVLASALAFAILSALIMSMTGNKLRAKLAAMV